MNDNNQGYNDNNLNKPLFDGAFNNGSNQITPNTINNPLPTNGYPQPVFDPFSQQAGQFYQSPLTQPIVNEAFPQQDLPPSLDDIKNLDQATPVQAPTLDVLAPMNVMPEKIQPADPLQAYENGDFNFNTVQSQPQPVANPFNGVQQFDAANQFSVSNPVYPLPDLSNQPVMSTPTSFNNVNANFQTQLQPGMMSNQDNMFNPGFQAQPSVSYDLNPLPNNDVNQYQMPSFQSNNMLNNLGNSTKDTDLPVIDNDISLSGDKSADFVKDLPPVETQNYEPPVLDNNYSVVNNSISEPETEISEDLSNLGLDVSYNEPDILEIMDLDTEDDNAHEDGTTMILENVQKIKTLVDELKSNGVNIELEEFDFETMYQVIIKFNK